MAHAGGWLAARAGGGCGIPAPLVTHHDPGQSWTPSRSEARRRRLDLVESLGISLPCQAIPTDLWMACTAAYRS